MIETPDQTHPQLLAFVLAFFRSADRPFIYLIRHRKSGAVLFLGRLLNPSGLAD